MRMEAKPIAASDRKILIVDDDPEGLEIIAEAFRWEGYQVKKINSFDTDLDVIRDWQPDLCVLDVDIPEKDGQEALFNLKNLDPYMAVLFLSGNSTTEALIAGLDAGADDFIAKPFDPLELLARVRTQLRIKDLNDQLRLANDKLKELVDIDDLTGLFNMRSIYQRIDHEMERGRRFNRPVCVVMMDMDDFKNVNDGHDHLFGSFVLSEVGKIILQNIRNIDIGARYGGDEFLIVLTETNKEGAAVFCERLRRAIATTLFKNDKDSMRLTASMGFAITTSGDHMMDARALVRIADQALYEAKDAGRNCVRFTEVLGPLKAATGLAKNAKKAG